MTEKWQRIVAAKTLLGLGDQASMREIKEAYRKCAKEVHPDLAVPGKPVTPMQEINAAYAVLLEYCLNRRLPLLPPESGDEAMDPEDWWFDRFGEDPLWGRTRS
ncbi:MAG: J domain-containing protein [Proteobacteria bacterium]|nr:J domain-containing protein [Desulfobulbaceae bacterium]MBU4153907.1 J domain-containing protein [Pseudomonadota bacterium]MDP2106551.1 J domain-containing protein [Desulfobulbaceae bacterium]